MKGLQVQGVSHFVAAVYCLNCSMLLVRLKKKFNILFSRNVLIVQFFFQLACFDCLHCKGNGLLFKVERRSKVNLRSLLLTIEKVRQLALNIAVHWCNAKTVSVVHVKQWAALSEYFLF